MVLTLLQLFDFLSRSFFLNGFIDLSTIACSADESIIIFNSRKAKLYNSTGSDSNATARCLIAWCVI